MRDPFTLLSQTQHGTYLSLHKHVHLHVLKNAAQSVSSALFVSVIFHPYHWLAAALVPGCYCSGKRHILNLLNFGGRWQNCVLSQGVAASWPLFATVTMVNSKVATLCTLKYETFCCFLLWKYCIYMDVMGSDSIWFICHVLLLLICSIVQLYRGSKVTVFHKTSFFTPIYIFSKWLLVMHFVRNQPWLSSWPNKPLPFKFSVIEEGHVVISHSI